MDEFSYLEDVKKCELDILSSFVFACEQLGLSYFITGGTLLGAVRHRGFIPWDDDIDVMMPRKDYSIFLQNGSKFLPSHLFLQTYCTDKNYCQMFAKIRNSNTTFIEEDVKNIEMNHGVYIDIFPIDGYPHGLRSFNLKLRKKMTKLAVASDFYPHTFKRVFIGNICKILLFSFNKKTLLERFDKAASRFKMENCDDSICHGGAWPEKREVFPTKHCDGFQTIIFENLSLKAPLDIDEYLTKKYGDYMKLPPVEKRKSHHDSIIIDTKKSYLYYLTNNKKNEEL